MGIPQVGKATSRRKVDVIMLVVGLTVTFIGYSVAYYGITQLQGGNWSYLDLVIPSRWADAAGTARDGA
jgi:hypothetical protein